MASPTVSMPNRSTSIKQYDVPLSSDDREVFFEAPECRNRAGRGVVTGVLVGAGLWGAILALTGVIKL